MTSLSPFFCSQCGAANADLAVTCFACGQSLHTPSPQKPPHILLKGRYHTVNQLGQGGMGSVYKAEDTELGNRLVAVKEMSQRGLTEQEALEAVAWSPGGTRIASASGKTLHLWNTATCATITTYNQESAIQAVAWSSDSIHVASGSQDGNICLYKTNKATPDKNHITHNIHSAAVQAIAWSPDGKLLASASDDSTVRILDPATGTINLIYKGHTRPVKTVAWSPDGTLLASAGEDETVQLWDLTGKKLFTHLDYYATIYSVAWSPDGTRIAAGDGHKLVHVWITTR